MTANAARFIDTVHGNIRVQACPGTGPAAPLRPREKPWGTGPLRSDRE
ncbi:hypothetical protein [Mycobacterium sp. 852002-30065_SCH5024008]|nr:hypothetical protein [Mycobacterium sp. 852002-30065_SCH5024008]